MAPQKYLSLAPPPPAKRVGVPVFCSFVVFDNTTLLAMRSSLLLFFCYPLFWRNRTRMLPLSACSELFLPHRRTHQKRSLLPSPPSLGGPYTCGFFGEQIRDDGFETAAGYLGFTG